MEINVCDFFSLMKNNVLREKAEASNICSDTFNKIQKYSDEVINKWISDYQY